MIRSIAEIGALWPRCMCGHSAQDHDKNLKCRTTGPGQCPTCGQHSMKDVPCVCKKYTGPTWEEFKAKYLTPEEIKRYGWEEIER
jgi:hypothetical protein